MTAQQVIEALQLPGESRVDQRLTKKLLLERSRGTVAQKRAMQDGIEELLWVASLKPNNIGVPAFRDEGREYLEIAVLLLRLRPEAKAAKVQELVHRAIPYPVVLVAEAEEGVVLSLAHKRWSEAEHGETVTEDLHSAVLSGEAETDALFLASLGVAGLVAVDMQGLYQGWVDRVSAYSASRLLGTYTVPDTLEVGEALRAALRQYAALERELKALRARARAETQMGQRVELNLAIRRLKNEQDALKKAMESREQT